MKYLLLGLRFPVLMTTVSIIAMLKVSIIIGIIGLILSITDIWKRTKEYFIFVKLFRNRYRESFIQKYLSSRRQRDIIYFSAKRYGYHNQVKSLFESKGYKWYHILPDDNAIFKLTFWRNFFLG